MKDKTKEEIKEAQEVMEECKDGMPLNIWDDEFGDWLRKDGEYSPEAIEFIKEKVRQEREGE